jgi:tRNA nucleotidyltransferase (CCA-adding enzyme)
VVGAALKVAELRKERVVIVGGFVRDLIMQRDIGDYDIDLVVEGDGLGFAHELRREVGGDIREHGSFLTAKLTSPFLEVGGNAPLLSEVDIATARSEEYPRPGALPVVTPTTIEKDLWRRDFASNSLALPLSIFRDFLAGAVAADALSLHVVDPCGGLSDLKSSTLRILHPKSFVDDPTRLFRAVRYAVRLSFHFDKETLSGFYEAVKGGALATLSPRRIWNEFVCALDEETPGEVIQEFVERGLCSHLAIVDPDNAERVIDALDIITGHRDVVSPDEYRHAAKIILLGALMTSGHEAVAQATSEGGRMLKRAAAIYTGTISGNEHLSKGDMLARFGIHGESSVLDALLRESTS